MSSATGRSGAADPLGELLDRRGDSDPPDAVEDGRHRPDRVPLLSVPAALRSLDLRVGPGAVRGVLVLAVVAALVLAGRWVWVTQRSEPVSQSRVESVEAPGPGPTAGEASGAEAGEASGTGSAEAVGRPSDAPSTDAPSADGTAEEGASAEGTGAEDGRTDLLQHVVVHVTGQVADPGVVTLPVGARVVDAVTAAGGLTGEADESSLNLARQLADGEQVWVGRPGEDPPPGLRAGVAPGGGTLGAEGGVVSGEEPLLVDLNRATQAELEELPGVGPVTAGRILAWRDEHGGFSVPEELLEVSGIGERTLEQLRAHVTVGG